VLSCFEPWLSGCLAKVLGAEWARFLEILLTLVVGGGITWWVWRTRHTNEVRDAVQTFRGYLSLLRDELALTMRNTARELERDAHGVRMCRRGLVRARENVQRSQEEVTAKKWAKETSWDGPIRDFDRIIRGFDPIIAFLNSTPLSPELTLDVTVGRVYRLVDETQRLIREVEGLGRPGKLKADRGLIPPV
jgi:hypothetical protein